MFSIIDRECRQRNYVINLQNIVVDFEMAVINSVEQVFGNQVTKQGCFFHLTQNTWRKIQDLGLVPTFNTDPDFPLFAAMIDALAFLPVNDVVQGMAHLRQNAHPHPQAMELLQYFDTNYVNGVWRNIHRPGQPIVVRRIPPIFPHALWNVHIATLNNDPRTNNVCESWNNAFYHIVGHNHPSMWHSIQGIQKQHAKDLSVIAQDAIGQRPRQRIKQTLVQMQARLRNLCIDYNAGTKNLDEFLRGVAHNIRLNLN